MMEVDGKCRADAVARGLPGECKDRWTEIEKHRERKSERVTERDVSNNPHAMLLPQPNSYLYHQGLC